MPVITFQCPRCNKILTAADSAGGQLVSCDGCQTSLRVPTTAIAEETKAPTVPILEAAAAPQLSPAPPTEPERRGRPDTSESAAEPPRAPSRVWLWVVILIGGVLLVGVVGCVVAAGIGGYFLLPKVEEAKEDADLVKTKELTQACQAYRIDNDAWPPSLEALTQPKPDGQPPYLEASALQPKSVPNGQFHYDPTGAHNQGLKPDIWVDGPHGQIGNWMVPVGHK
jgi:Type II secretion system (T2SS), protein G